MPAIAIRSISLKNYRQFRGAVIKLNPAPGRNIAVIEGLNGSGKSNLVKAIRWCLFGPEPRKAIDCGLCNFEVFSRLKNDSSAVVEVEILLDTPEGQIKVSRSITAHKGTTGAELLETRSMKLTASRCTKACWHVFPGPQKEIARLFPPAIRQISFIETSDFQDLLCPHPPVLITERGLALKSYSRGEIVCAGYQALAALRKIAGAATPLFIDSPFMPLPPKSREYIAGFIRTEFKNVQLILLAHSGEYSKEIASSLSSKISDRLRIEPFVSRKGMCL